MVPAHPTAVPEPCGVPGLPAAQHPPTDRPPVGVQSVPRVEGEGDRQQQYPQQRSFRTAGCSVCVCVCALCPLQQRNAAADGRRRQGTCVQPASMEPKHARALRTDALGRDGGSPGSRGLGRGAYSGPYSPAPAPEQVPDADSGRLAGGAKGSSGVEEACNRYWGPVETMGGWAGAVLRWGVM